MNKIKNMCIFFSVLILISACGDKSSTKTDDTQLKTTKAKVEKLSEDAKSDNNSPKKVLNSEFSISETGKTVEDETPFKVELQVKDGKVKGTVTINEITLKASGVHAKGIRCWLAGKDSNDGIWRGYLTRKDTVGSLAISNSGASILINGNWNTK